jgi:hypothetical protein
MFCSRGDLVLLPIPFTDLSSKKVRPAIVVGHSTWPDAGLNVPSGIKGQICTIEKPS